MNTISRQTRAAHAILAAISILGTVLYATSFALCDSQQTLVHLAAAIGLAAGVSWIAFGLILRLSVARREIRPWFELCLRTQAIGIATLMSAAAANASFFAAWYGPTSYPIYPVFVVVHGGLLLLADVLMGAHFITGATALGMSWSRALAAWVAGLNGIFAIVFLVLLQVEFVS